MLNHEVVSVDTSFPSLSDADPHLMGFVYPPGARRRRQTATLPTINESSQETASSPSCDLMQVDERSDIAAADPGAILPRPPTPSPTPNIEGHPSPEVDMAPVQLVQVTPTATPTSEATNLLGPLNSMPLGDATASRSSPLGLGLQVPASAPTLPSASVLQPTAMQPSDDRPQSPVLASALPWIPVSSREGTPTQVPQTTEPPTQRIEDRPAQGIQATGEDTAASDPPVLAAALQPIPVSSREGTPAQVPQTTEPPTQRIEDRPAQEIQATGEDTAASDPPVLAAALQPIPVSSREGTPVQVPQTTEPPTQRIEDRPAQGIQATGEDTAASDPLAPASVMQTRPMVPVQQLPPPPLSPLTSLSSFSSPSSPAPNNDTLPPAVDASEELMEVISMTTLFSIT